jgi:putative transposase
MVDRRRFFEPGYCYHVFNRGVERRRLFRTPDEFQAFEELLTETHELHRLPVHTYELMPNHWHFVVRPETLEQLSAYFQHLAGTHAKRFRAVTRTAGQGHVYQDRFKSFPVQSDEHFLTLCRYVERNALRAGLVNQAEDWRWGALWHRLHGGQDWLTSDWPVPLPSQWLRLVNQPMTAAELGAIRRSIRRGVPLGDPDWVHSTAEHLGLQHTLRPSGRPRIAQR